MKIFHKTLTKTGRELYLYYPGDKNRTPFKRCSITVLMDDCNEKSVEDKINELGLKELADEYELVLSFPVPGKGGWNYNFSKDMLDDLKDYPALQSAMSKADDLPPKLNSLGIPSYEDMMSTWHPMNDTKYLIGIGSGASMALTLAACEPDNIAAILTDGGVLCEEALEKAVYSAIPVSLLNADPKAVDYFTKANEIDTIGENEDRAIYTNSQNSLESIVISKHEPKLTKELVRKTWDKNFSKVRRPNTGAHGNCEPRMEINKVGFEYYLEDTSLGDGKPHTWFVHVPTCAKNDPAKKVPIMFFYHGGSDNPAEAAEMSKFHELGEKEGFITVYPWGSNRAGWNSNLLPEEDDDVDFLTRLIGFMIDKYPVDSERVYLSGFSNGAGMVQTLALCHPELVAAICHIDSNFPGQRSGPSKVDINDVLPFVAGLKKKLEYDYKIPVWYTYGSREASYPVYNGCSQQHQYDYWKMYNNIEIKPTPERDNPDPTGCGVKGDVTEKLTPSKRHPEHYYDVQRFFTKDEHLNYYNYVVMHDKGHDVAQMDPELGWNYVKQFKRNPDGSVGLV